MFNKYLLTVVLSTICALATSSLIEDVDPVLSQQQLALSLLRHAYGKRVGIEAAASDEECFNYYFNEQNKISNEYNKEYSICKATAKNAKDKLTNESSQKRDEIIGRGSATCSDLVNCEQYEDGLEFFNCYSAASGTNYQVLYNIYTESSGEATDLQVSYQAIENEENKCTTTAKNNYVSSMAVCNGNMEKCLNGQPLPTDTTSSSTSEEPTTVSPTEPSTETTAQPTTVSPTEPSTETTAEPTTVSPTEPSTEEPQTTTTASTSEVTNEPETTTTPQEPTTTESSSVATEEPQTTTPEEPSTTEGTEEPITTTTTQSTTEAETETTAGSTSETEPNTPEEPETTTSEESSSSAFTTESPETTTEQSPEEDLFSLKSKFNLWNILKKFSA